ncbi:hypothetical protein BJ912DRAFT_1043080 [Pholiota molesta]|nr:hypothetical protein BJ912DRAFT_1043080 [Pholiota molesta]
MRENRGCGIIDVEVHGPSAQLHEGRGVQIPGRNIPMSSPASSPPVSFAPSSTNACHNLRLLNQGPSFMYSLHIYEESTRLLSDIIGASIQVTSKDYGLQPSVHLDFPAGYDSLSRPTAPGTCTVPSIGNGLGIETSWNQGIRVQRILRRTWKNALSTCPFRVRVPLYLTSGVKQHARRDVLRPVTAARESLAEAVIVLRGPGSFYSLCAFNRQDGDEEVKVQFSEYLSHLLYLLDNPNTLEPMENTQASTTTMFQKTGTRKTAAIDTFGQDEENGDDIAFLQPGQVSPHNPLTASQVQTVPHRPPPLALRMGQHGNIVSPLPRSAARPRALFPISSIQSVPLLRYNEERGDERECTNVQKGIKIIGILVQKESWDFDPTFTWQSTE